MDSINLNTIDDDIDEVLAQNDPRCRRCGEDVPLDVHQLGLAPRYLVGRICINCGEIEYVFALRASREEARAAVAELALKTVFPKLSVDDHYR
jgi:hypothetical protein